MSGSAVKRELKAEPTTVFIAQAQLEPPPNIIPKVETQTEPDPSLPSDHEQELRQSLSGDEQTPTELAQARDKIVQQEEQIQQQREQIQQQGEQIREQGDILDERRGLLRELGEQLRVNQKEEDSLESTAKEKATFLDALLELQEDLFRQKKQLLEQNEQLLNEKKIRDDEIAELKASIQKIRDALPPPEERLDHTSPAAERITVDLTTDPEVDETEDEADDPRYFLPLEAASAVEAFKRMDDVIQRRHVERLASTSGLKRRPAQPFVHPIAAKKSCRPE